MPRVARTRSATGIYHIIIRGINRQTIFKDEEDNIKLIQTLQKYKETCEYSLYAYCLMKNHLHLLLKEGKEPLETIMRKICSSYVLWYNKKYDRVGYLFQDRFRSEPVEDDKYFLTVIRYIFQNPLKAGIESKIQNYRWTNYSDYVGGNTKTDNDFVLNFFHTDRRKAIDGFIEFINQENDDKCIDIAEKRQIRDDDARRIIKKYCKVDHAMDIQKFEKSKKNSCLRDLKEKYDLSIRQIERLTGINRGTIQRA
ncbi:MAG: transposase [Natronincolaceae bacterium]|jgi:putative transposase